MKEKINMEEGGSKRRFLVLIAAIAVLGLCGCRSRETLLLESEDMVKTAYESERDAEQAASQGTETETLRDTEAAVKQVEESTLFVHICGAVREPGVYELAGGSRVYDAVEAAGGFHEDADESYVNMALSLEDGWKIVIPTIEETSIMSTDKTAQDGEEGVGILAGTESIQETSGKSGKGGNGLVNINTAGREELCTLPGIGASRAESIIAYREKNGGFSKIEDIMQIEGIKEGMFAKLKERICVD